MILVIDNYDSFVHNLARYFRQLGKETSVVRNDELTIDSIRKMAPEAIVISPGPCTPDEAGISQAAVSAFAQTVPILGVCLGHQAIVQALGGNVVRTDQPMHGRSTEITHSGSRLFEGIAQNCSVGRYHSLVTEAQSMPDCLQVTSQTREGIVMSVEHRSLPIVGMQFHPESILTQHGHRLLLNFLKIARCLPDDNELNGLCDQLRQQEIMAGATDDS